jgi:hypothetical protein
MTIVELRPANERRPSQRHRLELCSSISMCVGVSVSVCMRVCLGHIVLGELGGGGRRGGDVMSCSSLMCLSVYIPVYTPSSRPARIYTHTYIYITHIYEVYVWVFWVHAEKQQFSVYNNTLKG